MTSTVFSLELAKESLSEDEKGFFNLEDLAIRDSVLEIDKRGFDYFSEYSLDFYKYILNIISKTKHSTIFI
jgi:hypothetical protein